MMNYGLVLFLEASWIYLRGGERVTLNGFFGKKQEHSGYIAYIIDKEERSSSFFDYEYTTVFVSEKI